MIPYRNVSPAMLMMQMPGLGNMQRGGTMPPQLQRPPQPTQQPDPTLGLGMGMFAQGMKPRPDGMPQWQPGNEAANAIQGGEYPDPLLRQSAQWNVPGQGGLAQWLQGLFR